MSLVPVPMSERQSRLPVAGRIRLGHQVPFVNDRGERKFKPVALETFRFTSRHGDDIDKLAEMYGGEPRGWKNAKSEDKFEVITEASEIRVVLPSDPLGQSYYELWGGRGCERRCDGIKCESPVQTREGLEWAEGPCLCRQRGVKECKPKLRLAVILPEVKLRGVWRMDTSSDAAVDELPEMVKTLAVLQGEGLTQGLLRLEKRQSQGGRQHFVVPALGIAESVDGLIAGRARLAALPQSAGGGEGNAGSVRPSLPPASPSIDGNCGLDQDKGGWEQDDEVVDAELVDEEPSAAEKARALRVARQTAILNGDEPPTSWEELDRGS